MVAGQRRHGARPRCPERSSPTPWSCARRRRSSSRTRSRSRPTAAVLLNLAEDHLDRHGTFENYRAAKLAIFAHQPPGTLAVVPAGLALDDAGGAATRITFGESAAATRRRGTRGGTAPTPISPTATARCTGAASALMAAAEIRLRGPHNRENAMAAAAVCLARGLDRRRGAARGCGRSGRRASARGDRDGRRRSLRQRLQGDERRVGRGRASGRSTGRVHLIAGGEREGLGLHPARGARRGALHGGLSDRRDRAAAARRARSAPASPIDDAHDLERAFAHARREARSR